ncbi:type I-E CRISPR-associated protein Cas7/Cse4/CasC [Lentilactobacillus raoultii]|uniref:Type I-E CRISPR-associated protein Cas7/Cse4/CasC n=1 Tax=Lentilactobacillus raoultii TaxID=1987503 RepID=A0ABW3PHV8_9LACO|nr:type I-E CRISPR-associated protein Cas7/Cse4/CasC [Lentilactobacillus raoultii]
MTQNLYIDINVLQTVPSSNINRDDNGAPKTALYGGVTRSRVSSQSWKYAMRKGFETDNIENGIRTKKVVEELSKDLAAVDESLDDKSATQKAVAVLKKFGIKFETEKGNKNKSSALLMVSHGQIKKFAKYVTAHDILKQKNITSKTKKEIEKVLSGDRTLDLALFGRMVADDAELNVEGAAQVAHAISTHEVVPEFDYFTATDDLSKKSESGAAMLGTIEYNSATLYRYANLNVKELSENLGTTNTVEAAKDFIKVFISTMPTGKQHTFANKTVPNYVMINVRTDTPVNLITAFETPVSADNGYVAKSIEALETEYDETQQFVDAPLLTVVLAERKYNSIIENRVDKLSELLSQVTDVVSKAVQDEDHND